LKLISTSSAINLVTAIILTIKFNFALGDGCRIQVVQVVRFFLLIVGLHVVGAYVHEVRANLQHFTYIWKVFFLDDGPVLGDALPKHLDYLNLIFKHYENAPIAFIFRVSSKG
jgi:hypothetical protein